MSEGKEKPSLIVGVGGYEELKPLQEKLNTFKFKKRRELFKQEHESDFRRFYLAKRKLKEAVPDGEPPVDVWKNEMSQLEQEYRQQSAQASLIWKESKKLRELQVLVNAFAASFIKGVLDNPVYCGKLAYGRRKNEKIPGKRNAYHIVKQDSYMLYDGIHEAIVSEEIWNTAHDRRLRTGVCSL